MRRLHFALLSFVLAVAVQPLVAVTYYVGTCKVGAFGSISAAVAGVPAGSTIDVCPGNYPEQVVISKALTLKGIFSNNSSQAVIAMPSAGLTTTSSLSYGSTVAAQVEVNTTGVNITGITVDGTATSTTCPTADYYIGIFYSSGSSGTVDNVETRNQKCSGSLNGIGIVAENGAGTAQSVTIENSDVNSYSSGGIWACSNQTPSTLTASIKGNFVSGGNLSYYGIITLCVNGLSNAAGSVSGNNISAIGIGVFADSASSVVSGNTITGGQAGIDVFAPGSITSNHISGSSVAGIYFEAPGANGATVKTNTITQSPIGIEFNCFTGTVSGNIINGTAKGIDMVPAAFTEVNTFYNVPTVRTNGAC